MNNDEKKEIDRRWTHTDGWERQLEEKRAAAIEWLRSRGKHVLQQKHTRERHQAVQEALNSSEPTPPKAEKVRRIK